MVRARTWVLALSVVAGVCACNPANEEPPPEADDGAKAPSPTPPAEVEAEVEVEDGPPAPESPPPTAREVATATITDAWCERVVRPFDALYGHYPFDAGGSGAPLSDLSAFFHPETGTVWTFYEAHLSKRLPRVGRRYVIETSETEETDETEPLDPNVARFFDRARDVTTTMFSPDDPTLGFDFDVQVQGAIYVAGVSGTTLTVDDQEIELRGGPFTWRPMHWPGPGTPGAQIEVQGVGIHGKWSHAGPWGLFRLVESGKATVLPDRESVKLEWDLRSQAAGVVVAMMRARHDGPAPRNPVHPLGLLQRLRDPDLVPPRAIVLHGPGC